MIRDFIEISRSFQSSVNIEYDFNNKRIIDGFIPTNACLEIINDVIASTEGISNSRAKILTGAYGRGKSLCILIALSILHNKDKKLFKSFLTKVKKSNEEIYKRFDNFITGKNKFLPVIINGNSGNMTQAFLASLQRALSLFELEDIMPETYFDSAIRTINRWENEYPDTLAKFEEFVDMSSDDFIIKLKMSDNSAYKKFVEIHPNLTSGSKFNPFVDSSVVEIYDNVNIQLKAKGYAGIFVVYDEFGKYLESNISIASESETKMLQDFAEKCNREGSQQLHLMLVCHKDISNYIDNNLSKDKVDGWRGISGRFEHINLSNNFSQTYEIIAHTMTKEQEAWETFFCANKEKFGNLETIYKDSSLLSGKWKLVIEECYPLHPVTTFVLPRLSEKIAQNERTLFTFLSANQKNTLVQFIDKNEDDFPLVTPDYLFDYFEKELRKELNSSDTYKVYDLANRILRNFEHESLAAKIIKTIALIHIIQRFERLEPIMDVIVDIYSFAYTNKEITDEINRLINEQYILFRKNSNNFLCLKPTSGININQEIQRLSESLTDKMSVTEIINKCTNVKYLYPTAYNDDNAITRYFKFEFVDYDNYVSLIQESIPNHIAGKVYAIYCKNEDEYNKMRSELIENISIGFRTITIAPKEYFARVSGFVRYLAAKELREQAQGDELLFEEYSLYLSDYGDVIKDYISKYINPEQSMVEYYYEGEKVSISRKSQLSGLLSKICTGIYTATPIINNESLNKDNLPGIAVNSRAKILNSLLENEHLEENLGLKGVGQDVSFMRSALIQTKVLVADENGEYKLDLNTKYPNLSNVFKVIWDFFKSTVDSKEKSFDTLYNTLTSPDGNIGLKRGVIPIFLAVVLNGGKRDLVFKCNNEEIKITADTLNAINEKPELYSVKMENWDGEKAEYLSSLERVFNEHIYEKEKSFNGFSYIASAINRWFLSLPKCAREMNVDYSTGKPIEKTYVKFIETLKRPNVNSREFLLETIIKTFGADKAQVAIALEVEKVKELYDLSKSKLRKGVENVIRETFKFKMDESLKSGLNNWYDTLKPTTIQHLFANNENAVLTLISTITNDEKIFVERLGKAITGLRLDDWNYKIFETFKKEIVHFKAEVERFNKEVQNQNGTNEYKMIFTDEDGNEMVRSFEKVEYSSKASLLYSDILGAVEDMGQAITMQEKRQVLMDVLKSLCD